MHVQYKCTYIIQTFTKWQLYTIIMVCIQCMVMVDLIISHNLQCLVLCLMVVVPYIGPYGTLANSSEQEGLKQLISSG